MARPSLPPLADLVIGGMLAAYAVLEVFVSDGATSQRVPLQVLVALLTTLPVVLRRRRPAQVALFVSAVFATKAFLFDPMPELLAEALALLVSLYTAGALLRLRPAVAVLLAVTAVSSLRGIGMPETDVGGQLVNLGFGVLAWSIGRLVRGLESRAVRSEQRVRVVEDWAEQTSTEAVADERARIARELHDIVAHNIGVVLLHAGGGRRMLDHDVEQARTAFDTIEGAAGQALAEMRRLLHVLRAEHEPLAPQPSIADLPSLADRVRSAGVDVSLDIRPVEVSPGLSLCVYRIVQEALTNAVRHGRAGRVDVTVRRDETGDLLLDVVDDGTTEGAPHSGGHGLVGMRERVALFGGRLDVGPCAAGGFAVQARIPEETA